MNNLLIQDNIENIHDNLNNPHNELLLAYNNLLLAKDNTEKVHGSLSIAYNDAEFILKWQPSRSMYRILTDTA